MDARTFEGIKSKIETLKAKKSRAEGAVETIVAQWKADYKFDTADEALATLVDMEDKQSKLKAEIDEYYVELEGLTNWAAV
jgi:hypothetical protein